MPEELIAADAPAVLDTILARLKKPGIIFSTGDPENWTGCALALTEPERIFLVEILGAEITKREQAARIGGGP
jgi:hypothetical protein